MKGEEASATRRDGDGPAEVNADASRPQSQLASGFHNRTRHTVPLSRSPVRFQGNFRECPPRGVPCTRRGGTGKEETVQSTDWEITVLVLTLRITLAILEVMKTRRDNDGSSDQS